MGKTILSFWDFVKAAFHLKVKAPLLGHLPINKIILAGFAILGFGHPGFWFVGLAYESAYLFILAGDKRFQKFIQSLDLEKDTAVYTLKKQQLYENLDKPSKSRYDRIFEKCIEILKVAQQIPGQMGKAQFESQGLHQLQWIFLKLLNSSIRIKKTLIEVNKTEIEKEIEKINKALAVSEENSSLSRSLQSTLEIQIRRLDNLKKAEENLTITETELNRIEYQVNLLKEEMAISSDADLLSLRLDGVMDSIQGTTKWMAENYELFGNIEEESPLTSAGKAPLSLTQKE